MAVAFRSLSFSRWWTNRAPLTTLLCAAALFSIAFSGPPPGLAETTIGATATSSKTAEYVGSESCAGCHASEHADWNKSHHKAAMQVATDVTVLGNFNGVTFEKNGTESVFFKREGKFWVRTDGPDGKLDDFEILYTFGVAPLQQYLIGLPGGRLQAFGIAWDARPASDGGQRWYHLYPDRKLAAGDPLHWTGIDQNWNYQCAFCHSTNLQKNYDAATTQFKTTWSEISVGCEACHGPGSRHLDWATKTVDGKRVDDPGKGFAFTLDERPGVSWRTGLDGYLSRSVPRTEDKVVHVCAACHSRRQQFSSDPLAVSKFFDAFRPSLLAADLYHSDGQQRDEVYNYGSFLQSRMHAAGVTCSDCHNPHSGALRHEGNATCTQCHAPERFDAPAHHHHETLSKGAECAACHMPTTTYMGVHARHDHSIRIPRPDRSVTLGTPNACNQCHVDKTAVWARDAIKIWYPSPKPGAQDFAEAFDKGDLGSPGAQSALSKIAAAETSTDIARASALARLRRYPSPEVVALAARALQIDDPLVRTAAVSVIANADASTRQRLLVPLLRDKARLVRMDAARALAGDGEANLTADNRTALELAMAEYVDSQLFNAERPESHANLGALFRDRHKVGEAKAAFEKALQIDTRFFAASISLADVVRSAGDERAAEKILRDALAANPGSGPVHHALGLSLIRQKRTLEAVDQLARAVAASPEDPRFSYVLAVALHDTGKRTEAIDTLKSALTRHPYDRDSLWALASYEIETQDFSSALARAALLAELEPGSAEVAQLMAVLKRKTQR